MTNKQELFNTIMSSIQEIENELHGVDKGIFFAPELYIAFKMGFSIYQNRKNIFIGEKVEWLRETSFSKGSIADIAFEVDDKKCVFELKVRSTGPSYESDINKLLSCAMGLPKLELQIKMGSQLLLFGSI